MGQIQNSIDSLIAKSIAAAVGKNLTDEAAVTKAYAAQDKANEYYNTEVKQADRASLDAGKALGEALAKRDKLGEKYGAEFELIREGPLLGGETVASVDESKLSKNPLTQKSQVGRLVKANYDYNMALQANMAATQQLNLKKKQYEAFKERAEKLSRKADVPMSTAFSPEAEERKKMLNTMEWANETFLKGDKKGGKKDGK